MGEKDRDAEIGLRIKKIRQNQKITQVQLANQLGVSQTAIALWENGSRRIPLEIIDEIALILNISASYLLFGDVDFNDNIENKVSNSSTGENQEYTGNSNNSYYLDDETKEIAQEVFENPELRTLFHVARDIPPERLKAHIEFMKSLKAQEKGDPDEPC